jgi:hypothetical protein
MIPFFLAMAGEWVSALAPGDDDVVVGKGCFSRPQVARLHPFEDGLGRLLHHADQALDGLRRTAQTIGPIVSTTPLCRPGARWSPAYSPVVLPMA